MVKDLHHTQCKFRWKKLIDHVKKLLTQRGQDRKKKETPKLLKTAIKYWSRLVQLRKRRNYTKTAIYEVNTHVIWNDNVDEYLTAKEIQAASNLYKTKLLDLEKSLNINFDIDHDAGDNEDIKMNNNDDENEQHPKKKQRKSRKRGASKEMQVELDADKQKHDELKRLQIAKKHQKVQQLQEQQRLKSFRRNQQSAQSFIAGRGRDDKEVQINMNSSQYTQFQEFLKLQSQQNDDNDDMDNDI